MAKRVGKKLLEGAHLKAKPEDMAWKQWFDKLSTKEHENYLHKLGLSDEEIKEWEEDIGMRKGGKKEKG